MRTAARLTPYQSLARTHALMAAGDAVMAVALANSLFLSISPEAARSRVLLFLAVSVAPFAIVAPLIGPVIDRMAGGRRLVVQIVAASRLGIALAMAVSLDSLLLFPLAFAAMVLQKTYSVSKSALVPTVVHHEIELVEANSKLGIISGVVGFLAAVPAGALHYVNDASAMLFDAVVFGAALWSARQLPREVVAPHAADRAERDELRSHSVVFAASAMGLLRACVGFLFFHLAFWLRGQQAGTAWFGVGVSFAALGTLLGNSIAPKLRRRVREEPMLAGALGLAAMSGALATVTASILSALLLMAAVNLAAAVGRLGFDAIVQRNAPDANQGRAFAQFETRFQLGWVMAGIIPVLVDLPGWLGFAVISVLAGFAMVTYVASLRRVHLGQPIRLPLSSRAVSGARARWAGRTPAPTRTPWSGQPPPPGAGRSQPPIADTSMPHPEARRR